MRRFRVRPSANLGINFVPPAPKLFKCVRPNATTKTDRAFEQFYPRVVWDQRKPTVDVHIWNDVIVLSRLHYENLVTKRSAYAFFRKESHLRSGSDHDVDVYLYVPGRQRRIRNLVEFTNVATQYVNDSHN